MPGWTHDRDDHGQAPGAHLGRLLAHGPRHRGNPTAVHAALDYLTGLVGYRSGVDGGWDGVRERVERLRRASERGRGRTVFGADGHEFELLAPLSQADLAEAEAQFGVVLPEDYRDFLRTVSAGGAGPCYGLFPLARDSSGRWGWRGDGADMTDLPALGIDFHPTDVTQVLARLKSCEPSAGNETAYLAWLDRYEAVLWPEQRTRGAICICHEGCAYRDWLVVTGPHRGEIWDDERAGDVDLAPSRTADGTILTFGAWYLTWLADAERILLGPEATSPGRGDRRRRRARPPSS